MGIIENEKPEIRLSDIARRDGPSILHLSKNECKLLQKREEATRFG